MRIVYKGKELTTKTLRVIRVIPLTGYTMESNLVYSSVYRIARKCRTWYAFCELCKKIFRQLGEKSNKVHQH